MTESHNGASRSMNLQPDPADHVLTHIYNGVARWRLQDPHRFQFLCLAHWWASGSNEIILAVSGDPRTGPTSIVKARYAPSWLLESRIIGFTVVDLRHQDRTFRRFPVLIGRDQLFASILVHDFDLHQESEPVTIKVSTTFEPNCSSIPAIAKCYPNCVITGFQQVSY